MKKYLSFLIVGCAFIFSATYAATLEGIIYEFGGEENKVLDGVEIILDNTLLNELSDGKGFKTRDFEVKEQGIHFKLDGYYVTVGNITIETSNGIEYLVYNDNFISNYYFGVIKKKSDGSYDENAKYTLGVGQNTNKIQLLLETIPVITGYVEYENGEKAKDVSVTGIVSKDNGLTLPVDEVTTDQDGKFVIEGYTNFDQKFELLFSANGYNDEAKTVNLEKGDVVIIDEPVVLEQRSTAGNIQDDLVEMTGFGCSSLMPKYLVGASCVKNRELKGDATDIALWIQKLGSKITALISMIAVVLIVWNAFNIVTAVGDSEKIAQGKKGILWTILGLTVTMFAYVIVKTVIVLTYTQ